MCKLLGQWSSICCKSALIAAWRKAMLSSCPAPSFVLWSLNVAKSSGTQPILGVHSQSHPQWAPPPSQIWMCWSPKRLHRTLKPTPAGGGHCSSSPDGWTWILTCGCTYGPVWWSPPMDVCGFCRWPGSWSNEPSILFFFPCCRQPAFPAAASMRLQQQKEACEFS